jgi:acyl carrier protein
MNDIIAELSQYIANTVLNQPQRIITPQEPIISSGILDSFHLVDLAMHIEDHYGVRIEDTELNRQTFDNLDQLAALISSRL